MRAGLVGLPPTAPPGHHLQMRPNARIVPLGGPRPASPALKVENGGDDLVHKWWHCCVCILPNSTRGTGAPGQLKGSHQEVQSSELWEADGSTEPHIGASSTHLHLGRQYIDEKMLKKRRRKKMHTSLYNLYNLGHKGFSFPARRGQPCQDGTDKPRHTVPQPTSYSSSKKYPKTFRKYNILPILVW